MASYHAPQEWEDWFVWLEAGLHGRNRWRLPAVMMGVLFAGGRQVVAAWIRTAGVSDDYQDYYFFLQSVGNPHLDDALSLLVSLRESSSSGLDTHHQALQLGGHSHPN